MVGDQFIGFQEDQTLEAIYLMTSLLLSITFAPLNKLKEIY
ncbi:hypothetical protein RBEAN4_0008 [Rickettsia bellii str. RML An4]|uniref:Uncharacterized protein n=1 Tax=Rickettsia bellii str. RML An4 TaxID=1359193 RepID=A0A0F3Q936_RICBE|nr:hypothetical protein RBEAN4_0008 [Rickettsia bellii str. RML An4]